MLTKLPNPKDKGLIIFLFKHRNTIWSDESWEQTQQINNKESVFRTSLMCHTPPINSVQLVEQMVGKGFAYQSIWRGGSLRGHINGLWAFSLWCQHQDMQECLCGIDKNHGIKNWSKSSVWVRLLGFLKYFYSSLGSELVQPRVNTR